MADYKLTAEQEPCTVIREADGACIPPDMANRDYNGDQFSPGYVQWVGNGGVPDPYVPPEPAPPEPTTGQATMYDHENRIRALEGSPPLTLEELIDKMKSER